MKDRPEWFAPKRYGYGAGLPIAWQGWVVLAVLIALIGLAAWFVGLGNSKTLVIILPAITGLLIVTVKTTRGGWRWRRGEED